MKAILWKASWRYLIHQPIQLAIAILGIALGVAIVTSIDLARISAERAFDVTYEAVVGQATHQITGGPDGLDESLYVTSRVAEGFYPVAPVIQDYVTFPTQPRQTLQILGVDPFAEAAFRAYWEFRRRDDAEDSGNTVYRLVTELGTALMSQATGQRLGIQLGEELKIEVGSLIRRVRIIDWIEPTDASSPHALDDLIITDIATAQTLLNMPGKLSHIDFKIADEPPGEAVIQRVQRSLSPGLTLTTAGTRSQATKKMARAFHINLVALSLLALLVSAFLIYNTMNFFVVRRRELIGALRTLGVTRAQVFRIILGEAFAIGAIGTLCGLVLGLGLGQGLVRLVTRTINDMYFVVTVRELILTPMALAKGLTLGVGVTLLVALALAREAAGVEPRRALSRSDLESRYNRLIPRAAILGLLVIGLGGVTLILSGKSIVLGFAAQFTLILGCALLTPAATVGCVHAFKPLTVRWLGVTGKMAARNVTRSLSRTAMAIAALMVAIATTVGVGLLISSFRLAVASWLHNILRADMYISTPGPSSTAPASEFDFAFKARIGSTPGVAALSTLRRFSIEMQGEIIDVAVYELAPESYGGFHFKAGNPSEVWNSFEHEDAVIVTEPFAYHHGVQKGDILQLRTERGLQDFVVAAIYYDYSSDQGAVTMSRRTYERFWNNRGYTSIGVYAQPGIDDETLRARLQNRIPSEQRVIISLSRAIRDDSMKLFDRTFAITEVLRVLAAVIAFVGVMSALMALQLDRTRELGVLRACGMTPAQLWGLLVGETGLMGFIAGLIAVPVGLMVAVTLVMVIYRRSFGWTIDLHINPIILLQGLALAVIAALLAGLYPAHKMARTSPAEALRNE